jgi:hypothetical protein
MGNEGFAGVDLSHIGAEATGHENSEARAEDVNGQEPVKQEASQSQSTGVPELDKLERFRFEGRDLTPKELKQAFLRQDDYTRKTQSLAETRKYVDNFAADAQAVLDKPELLAKFQELYPPEYHALMERYLKLGKQPDTQSTATEKPAINMPPEVEQMVQEIRQHQQEVREQKVQAATETINSLHTRLGEKFPYADADVVDRRIELAIEKGLKITHENLSKVYENAYKSHHEALKSRLDKLASRKVGDQVAAGRAARDVSGGGGLPAQAPKKHKNFASITQDALAAFGGK